MDSDKALLYKLIRRLAQEPSKAEQKKGKDAWDKAAIIFSAMSSVVLASVALLVNSTIQKTQINAADRTEQAQIRNENAKATTDLIQHLLSNDPARQEIALVALRRAVRDDDEMVVDIVSVVARTAHDEGVFEAATETLSESKSPKVARVLSQIAVSRSKAQGTTSTAQAAYFASQHVAIRASLPPGTAIFYAARPGFVAFENNQLQSGVFTSFLLRALNSEPDQVMSNGVLRTDSLYTYLSQGVSNFVMASYHQPEVPMVETSGSKNIPLVPPAAKRVFLVSIGISRYAGSRFAALQYPVKDASDVSSFFQRHGGTTSLFTDASATRAAILNALATVGLDAPEDSTFVMYYSGHGWNVNGEQYIAPADVEIPLKTRPLEAADAAGTTKSINLPDYIGVPDRSISFTEVRSALVKIRSAHKLLLIDACANDPFRSR